MEKKEMINRVAEGLKRMKREPDAFLFLQSYANGYTWDREKICGFPVYHCELLSNQRADSMGCDATFMPIFLKEYTSCFQDTWAFCQGFEEF